MPAAENRSAPLSELRELLSSLRGDTLRGGKLLFIVIVALILGATASAQNVTGTIGVGNGPAASATNPLTNTIYVLNSSDGTVSVINGATGQVIGSAITVGSDPVALAVDPVTNTIYVANKGSADVTPINGATNTAGSAIAVGTNPTAIAVNPVSDTIYVANNGSNNVTPINGATNTAGSAIAVGTNPAAIAVNSVTNTIYVANYGSNTVTPINGATNTAASAIAVGTNPTAIAVNPATNIIYVANNGSADVTPINGATNTAGSAIAVGTNPTAIAVNPVSNTIYVANNGSGNVTAINGTNNIPVTVTDASASAPIAVALNLTTNTVYVANNGSANVTAINGATNLVVASLAAGTDPVAIAVNPVTGMAYVANAGSASVAMISNATYANSSISDSSFASPNAIEVNPVTNEVYVANNGSSGSDTITVINPANNNSVSTVTDSSAIAPTAIAVNPATNMIYIADRTSRTVTVINAGNGNQVTTITPPGAAQPVAIAVNPVNNIIYVANSATNNVTMINAANSNHVSVISDPYALGPAAVAVNSVTGQVYVANSGSNSVSVFDGVTGLYVASIAAGVFPQAVAVNPVTNTVYVANSESSNVTVINGATNLVTATVGVPNSPVAVAVNPATNQIYVADASNETGDVTVINGATNATTTITSASLLSPNAIAVNPTTNKIYVADYDGYVTAIDGVTNTPVAVTDTNAQGPFAVAVNPVTNDAYLANDVSDNATAVAEQQVESNALQTAITPLANNATSSETPSFSFTATNGLTGAAPDNLVYQFDSWTGPWTVAVRDTSPGAFSATVATPLEPGFHTIFAFATDGEDGTSVNTGAQSSPLIGMIAAYGFLVAPQIATAFPPALTFASQTQSTSSAPQTAYLANEGEVALAFTYGFSGTNGTDFTEGSGDTCSTQGGTLAAGTSCTVSVVFTPSTTSSETASLVFTDNSNGIPESTQAVALSGTGSAIPSYTLNIGESGTGSGAVTSNPTGIACQPTCSASYPSGTQIKLTAAPGTGSAFVQWSGACTGATTTCTFTITANSTVTATFSLTAATACTGTTTNWTGGASGNWSNASNWSTGVVPNSASVVVCINNGASPSSAVVLDTSVSVGGLYIDPGSSLTIGDNITLVVSGTVSNSGQIIISSAADNSNLQINHTVTLTGGGTISMTETGAGGVPTLENYSFGNLTNVNNVIQGAGQIVNNSGWSFTNGPAGVINASSGNIFINEPMTNQGLMESTSTGVLQITINVINQLANIEAIGGSATVEFSVNADIQGGTLRTSGGGTMETLPSQTATLDGSTYGTLTIVGTYRGQDNSTTIATGTINNTGTMLFAAVADNVNLQINHTVTLTGGGTVMLSKSAAGQPTLENYSFGNLANVNNLIQGAGQIVNNSGWSFTNGPAGIINANQANGTLVISEPMTNQGLMEATGSSSALEIEVTITNPNANIKAIGSTAAVEFNVNANIQGGTLTTSGGGTIETLQNQTTTLDGSTYGTLTIVGTYTGQDNSTTIVAGTINNTGTILLAAIADNVNLQINHTVTLTGGGTVMLSKSGAGQPTLENYSFGNLTNVNNVIQGAGQIVNNSGWSFTNAPAGVIDASGGNIFINEPMTNQGLMEATSSGVLQIAVSISNAGEIVPDSSPDPGTISITGNLTESAAGAEGVFLGGLTAGTQYSQLNVSGTASLSGALDVAFINGFTPALGNQFTVLTASSVTGTFSSINSAALPQGVIWTLTYNPPSNPTSVVLAAVQGTSTSQTLTVADLGAGSGSVTDNLGQINCIDTAGVQSGTCSASYNTGTAVTLSATPVSPATFGGWGGACSGTGGCSVVMNSAQSVTASFVPVTSTSQTLTVADLGTGGGSVTDNLGQINCIDTAGVQSGTCSASYNTGTLVTLSATPVSPATFGGWGGACSGTGGCSVVMNSAQSVTASFVPQPPTAPVPFSCPGGVYPCSNVTSPPAVFNCPSGTNPCTDVNAHSLTFTAAQVNSPFTLTVEANEVPASQSNGDCPSGQTPSTYFACRFTSFFAYETLPNGDTIVPACDAYSNGNCVFYSIYYGTKGNEPPEGDFSGPIGWSIAWNNTSYPPPSGYPYQANNPRLYYDPDYEVSATTPYGTDCSVAMDINGAPTEPPIYCQFVFDITTYYDPTQPPDAGIGGKSKQFSDVVVAFPLSIAGPNLSVTKTADQTQVTAGSAIGYTITMSNSSAPGTGSATNATLNDPLPAGSGVNWSIAPAYSGQGTCTIAGAPPSQTLSCALGNLSPAISSSVHVSSSSSSAGTYNNTATFSAVNNAPQTSSASIQVVQESGGSVAFTPPSIDFETVYLGGAKLKKQVTMKNTGTSLLTISNISLAPAAGTGPDDFSFRSYCPLKLAAGKSCTIALFFSADAVGTPSAMLSVTDNVAGSPQQVSLSATVIDPQASFSPTNLSFKKLQVGSSSTQSLTLTNTGTTALNIASISVTGAEQGDFAESNDCPSVLAASTPCNISITFTPSATGFRSAKLRVVDNTEAGKQNVTLTGLGSE